MNYHRFKMVQLKNLIVVFIYFGTFKGYSCLFQSGKKLSKSFEVLNGPYGAKQCIKACLLKTRCQAIGYNRRQLRCELGETDEVEDDEDNASATATRGMLAEYQVLQITLGACSSHACAAGKQCIATRTGPSKICATSECDAPPTVINASPVGNKRLVGETVEYQCDSGNIFTGSQGVTCKANGQWSGPQFSCSGVGAVTTTSGPGVVGPTTANVPACPATYTVGVNFCIKYYSTYKSVADSEQQCQADGQGGRLIVIDSVTKHTAAGQIAINNKYKAIRIAGTYTQQNIWKFPSGALMNTSFFNPDTAHYWNSRRCCNIHYQTKVWFYGNDCSNTMQFMCEVPVM